MKKSLLALAALTAFAGAASAQSSVTLFGIVDAAYGHVSANGNSVTGISNSGINSSRLGFRGVEDLGGGLNANFWLEGQLNNDVGQGSGQTTAFDFQRRATVGVGGGFGDIKFGRDYSPSFWNTTVYDPFGTNGVGQSLAINMISRAAAGNAVNGVRANNSLSYFTPGTLGGFNAQVMVAFGENGAAATTVAAPNAKKANNYFGFRVGYAAGPVSAHFAYAKTTGAATATDTKYNNIGASYDAGVIKPIVFWGTEKAGSGAKVTGLLIGATIPVGSNEIRVATSRYDIANSANDFSKFAVGYVHNLSKRTALYTTYARVSNKGAQTAAVANNGLSAGAAAAGGGATGYEFGVRHAF